MTYSEKGDTVTLEMSRAEYGELVFIIGMAAGGALKIGDQQNLRAVIDFANRINAGNPNFLPYEIPEEFKTQGK